MGSFPTYGMAGVGIAAAIGFVFVLSFFGSQGGVDDGQLLQSNESAFEQQRTATEDQSQFAKDTVGADAPASESADIMQLSSAPVLNSIVALDANGELLGEVVPGMEFEAGQPVVIRASFANHNDAAAADYYMSLSVRSSDTTAQDGRLSNSASLRGDIGPQSLSELELSWFPQAAGEYTLQVFVAQGGRADIDQESAATIPITVLQ